MSEEELSAFSEPLLDDGGDDATRALLRERLASAVGAHAFRLPVGTFGRFGHFVACRLEPELPRAAAIGALDLAGLYLAYSCLEGVTGAAEAFFGLFSPDIMRVAAKFARSGSVTPDDLVQLVCKRMLIHGDELPPRISLYRGTGPLGGFVRVTAARLALDALDAKSSRVVRLEPEDGLFTALLVSPRTPEASLDQERARTHLRAAFARAAASLEPRDRNVLAYTLCDGLSIDAIGRMYGVHRATAARWIQSARDSLVLATRSELARDLAVNDSQLDTILRGGLSRFELSVERCLREGSA
jgi:RNA polymerase sigma-70 factor (ECF subfamily)